MFLVYGRMYRETMATYLSNLFLSILQAHNNGVYCNNNWCNNFSYIWHIYLLRKKGEINSLLVQTLPFLITKLLAGNDQRIAQKILGEKNASIFVSIQKTKQLSCVIKNLMSS